MCQYGMYWDVLLFLVNFTNIHNCLLYNSVSYATFAATLNFRDEKEVWFGNVCGRFHVMIVESTQWYCH